MKRAYLEVTFRHGRPFAAYLYLPRQGSEKSYRTVRAETGLMIDFDRQGKPIGIEITAPTKVSLASLNNTMRSLGLPLVRKADLAPLLAA
jgi:uncharacterized protein YuzE